MFHEPSDRVSEPQGVFIPHFKDCCSRRIGELCGRGRGGEPAPDGFQEGRKAPGPFGWDKGDRGNKGQVDPSPPTAQDGDIGQRHGV